MNKWLKNRKHTKRRLDATLGPLIDKKYQHDHYGGPALEQWELDYITEARRWIDEFCSPARKHNVRFVMNRVAHITWAFLDNEPDCDEETRWAMINISHDAIVAAIEEDSPGLLIQLPVETEDALTW